MVDEIDSVSDGTYSASLSVSVVEMVVASDCIDITENKHLLGSWLIS